ncbi:hypothetical protein BDZ94DRAFT_1275317 [Collybia nuda]|uniref:Uncharacterized protein n=1 Tax=Collybia nuda TaxID=64659 RepID=A0A9P5XTI1_9AGAR|nr:hypothetical protein BDZ94DRAFT_1275317 [Collybia nuda]
MMNFLDLTGVVVTHLRTFQMPSRLRIDHRLFHITSPTSFRPSKRSRGYVYVTGTPVVFSCIYLVRAR